MMQIVPKIECFNACTPPNFLKFELGESDLVGYLDGKLLKEMAKGGLSGALTSTITHVGIKALEIGINPEKKFGELIVKESLKKFGKTAIIGAGTGLVLGGVKRTAEVYRENVSIKQTWGSNLKVSVERAKDVIEAFLSDREFISQNASIEVTCPITQILIIHPIKLSCDHIFSHLEIKDWVEKKHNCPSCRAPSQLKDFRYSYETAIKVQFVFKKIYKNLHRFAAPNGIDIMDARRKMDPIFDDINKFNKIVYKQSVSYVNKEHSNNFDSMNDQLLNWKEKVDIR